MHGKYRIVITKSAQKDKEKVKALPALKRKAEELLEILRDNPFQTPPPYEKLQADLKGAYSRRLNRQHRFVCMVDEERKTVKIIYSKAVKFSGIEPRRLDWVEDRRQSLPLLSIAMWTHYE